MRTQLRITACFALGTFALLAAGGLCGCQSAARQNAGTAAEPQAAAPFDQQAEVAAIQSVLDAQQAAWNRGDVETYMSAGYWQSPKLVFLSGGSITRGYEPVLARYKARYQGVGKEMGRLTFSDTEIELWTTELAVARGRWDLATKGGKPQGGRYSLMLARLDVGWRIVQDHSSLD